MKKAASVAVTIILLIGGGLFYFVGMPHKKISPEVFLPENPLCYIHQHDFSKYFTAFFKTSIGETLHSFNLVKLSLDLGLPLNEVDFLRELQNFAATKEANGLFEEFFSNDCSLALLNGQKTEDYKDFLKNNLVVFTEPIHSPHVLDVMIDNIRSKYVISSTPYGNHTIYRFQKSAELAVTFVSVNGLTIFTLNERTLRRMLDRYDSRASNFSENYYFVDFQNNNKEAVSFCYFEIAPLSSYIATRFQRSFSIPKKSDFITILQGFTTGILSTSLKDNSVKNTIALHYNPNMVERDILHFLHIPPEKDSHLNSCPRDTLLYFWMNTFDIRRLWNVFVKKSKINKVLLESIEENISLTAGLPFDDLLNLFGNRVHFILRQPSQEDPVPLPNFTMIYELIDSDKAQSTLQHLFLLNKIPHGNDVYRDIPFTYWGNEMQNGLQPVYSIYDGYLYISSSVQMQLEVIAAMFGGNGLKAMYPFYSVADPLLMENNTSVFLKIREFVDFFKDFISLGEAMYSRQNKKAAYQTKTFVYEILFPLLDSLKMYSSITSAGNFENGKINIEIYLNKADN